MKILCLTGSRADYGAIEAVHKALLRRYMNAQFLGISSKSAAQSFDIAVVCGDRYEVLKEAVKLYIDRKVIVHLSGGDITEGSQDDSMRHAITKLAHLHFPTNPTSARRILQLGEEPWRVKMVGYPGVDTLDDIEKPNWVPNEFILAVWHPNTMTDKDEAVLESQIFTNALEKARGNMPVIIIGPNDDVGGPEIAEYFDEWADLTGNIFSYGEFRSKYLWLLKNARCLVGNSSSGIYEAPSFGTPVLNIGDRQKGRTKAANIYDCPMDEIAIELAIKQMLALNRSDMINNPFHNENAADKIAEVICNIKEPKKLLLKKFNELSD